MAEKISRRSVQINIEVEKGSTFRHTLVWTYEEEPQIPIDLTDCTALMQIRPEQDSDTIYYTLSSDPLHVNPLIEPPIPYEPGIVLGDVDGTIDLFIPADHSTQWDWEEGVYGLEITFPSTDVRRLCRGNLVAYNETTR